MKRQSAAPVVAVIVLELLALASMHSHHRRQERERILFTATSDPLLKLISEKANHDPRPLNAHEATQPSDIRDMLPTAQMLSEALSREGLADVVKKKDLVISGWLMTFYILKIEDKDADRKSIIYEIWAGHRGDGFMFRYPSVRATTFNLPPRSGSLTIESPPERILLCDQGATRADHCMPKEKKDREPTFSGDNQEGTL